MTALRGFVRSESFAIIIIFVVLCSASLLLITALVERDQVHQIIDHRSTSIRTTAAAPSVPPPAAVAVEPRSSTNADQDAVRTTMETWWQIHQMETWWHQQESHRPVPGRRIASQHRPLNAKLAEQSWGVEDVGYDPPRYLTDTARWPLHGPSGGKQ